MLESCDIRMSLGSQLSNLVTNPNPEFLERLQHYCPTGMSRIELTIYATKLYTFEDYVQSSDRIITFLSSCPTFKVPFSQQWLQVVNRLTQTMAIYIRNRKTFAYCHWWNSLTRRKQGLSRSNIDVKEVPTLLANFGFNDRLIHYSIVNTIDTRTYNIIEHQQYRRTAGPTAITLFPGMSNSLYPYRSVLQCTNLPFASIGMQSFHNITIEWPIHQLRRVRNASVAVIVRCDMDTVQNDTFDMSDLTAALDNVATPNTGLEHVESIQMSNYKTDRLVLKAGTIYSVTGYGHGTFRNKEYLCLTMDKSTFVRCSPGLEKVAAPEIAKGRPFKLHIIRIKKVRGAYDIECEVA